MNRSVTGGIYGMFVDTWDVYLPALVLPAAMSYFLPPSMSPSTSVTVSTLLFCASLLGRPIGGLIFGNLADRLGRKRVTLIAASGFTVCTLLLGLLPGYATWGFSVVILFALLRLVAGIFLGGGYAAPIPLALEQSPLQRRGMVGGMIASAAPAAFVIISLIQVFALQKLPKSSFLSWGWRLPFFLGVVLGILYLRHYLKVSEGNEDYWAQRRAQRKLPLRELLTGGNRKIIGQVFLLTSGYWFAAQMPVSLMPSLLTGELHQDAENVTVMNVVNSAITFFVVLAFSALGQRIGRKKLLFAISLTVTVATTTAFALMVVLAERNATFVLVAIFGIIANTLVSGPLGVMITYLNERFPLHIRSTGYSVGYTCGLLLPGLYSFWLLGLGSIMPYRFAPLVLIVLGGVLMTLAMFRSPETNDIVMAQPELARELQA